jgi:hypothetical protein
LSARWFKAIPCQSVDLKQCLVSQLIQSNITNCLTWYCFESTGWQDIALNQLADKILLWINCLTRDCIKSTGWQGIALNQLSVDLKQCLVSQLIQSNTLSASWFKAISCQPVDSKQYLVRQLVQSNTLSASWFNAKVLLWTNWLTRYCFKSTGWQGIALNQLADKVLL